jgi:hypothetical protein
MILGQNLGLGELWTLEDLAEAAAFGAPDARILCRWLGKEPPPGYGTNFQGDAFAADQPHHIRPEYEQMLVAQAEATRAVGGTVQLAMDSNQLQGLNGGMDLWAPDGRMRRRQFLHLTRHLARVIRPKRLEPISEPAGTCTPSTLWASYEETMDAVLGAVPDQRFALGARSYAANDILSAYRPEWATSRFAGHIDLTCNFQDDLVCNPALFEDRLAKVLAARDRWGVGVVANQVWSNPTNDPDGAFLARAIRRLCEEEVDSFIWTAVTRFEDGPGSLRYLANSNDPRSAHVKHAERWAAVTAAWQEAQP